MLSFIPIIIAGGFLFQRHLYFANQHYYFTFKALNDDAPYIGEVKRIAKKKSKAIIFFFLTSDLVFERTCYICLNRV